MNTNHENNIDGLTKQQAEKIAVGINLVFNNAQLFGADHPSTAVASNNLAAIISQSTSQNTMLTFLKNGKSLYVEKWNVDHRVNLARFLTNFGKCGIESISFTSGVCGEHIRQLIQYYADGITNGTTAETIGNQLKDCAIHTIYINYITYKKVSKNEKIVDSNAEVSSVFTPTTPITAPTQPITTREYTKTDENSMQSEVFNRLGKFFNINDLLSGQNFRDLLFNTAEGNFGDGSGSWGIPQISEQFRKLRIDVQQNHLESGEAINYDKLFESLLDMSQSLKINQTLQENLAKLADRKQIISEMSQLTQDTMLAIIKEEIKKGNVSVPRIAHLIKRLSPTREELQDLLPQIKRVMLDAGLHITHFLDLTIEIDKNFSTETALSTLFKKAEDFGVHENEILEALQTNPGESIKLLLQSAEIQKRTQGSQIDLSEHLAGLIENVTGSIAEQRMHTAGKNDNIHTVVGSLISTLERDILQKLRQEGAENELTDRVQSELQERFPKTLEKIKTEWLVNTLEKADTMTTEGILHVLNRVVTDSNDVDSYRSSIDRFSEKFNLTPEEITSILTTARYQKNLDEKKKGLILLPPKTTIHFIKRYLEEYRRHNHPFSIISISETNPADTHQLLTLSENIAFFIAESFRVLDITGYLRVRGKDIAIVILPMTPGERLDIVLARMHKKLDSSMYTIGSKNYEDPMELESYDILMKQLLRIHL